MVNVFRSFIIFQSVDNASGRIITLKFKMPFNYAFLLAWFNCAFNVMK